MTEKELRELLAVWKHRLGLDAWRLSLRVGGCESETSYMEVERSPLFDRATVLVSPWMLDGGTPIPAGVLFRDEGLTDEFVEVCLVHELLHLSTRDLSRIVRDDLEAHLHPDAHLIFRKAFERHEEQTIDRLAEALVRSFRSAA